MSYIVEDDEDDEDDDVVCAVLDSVPHSSATATSVLLAGAGVWSPV